MPDVVPAEADDAEIICIPNFRIGMMTPPREVLAPEIDWVVERYAAGARLATACSGSALLADAGLLDGEDATAHWSMAEVFEKRYPRAFSAQLRVIVRRTMCNR